MTADTPLAAHPLAIVVLAAGQGTRMKSDLHKVLHPIAGRAMIDHLLANAAQLAPARQVVVVGSGREQLEAALGGRAEIVVQDPQHGTGHAVLQTEAALAGFEGDVLILYGDVPFVSAATMQMMLERLHYDDAPAVVVLGFEPDDALHYGRVLAHADGRIAKMVEFKDASDDERACTLCNSGLMAVRSADLFGLLARVGNANSQGEYYLVDIVNIANTDGRTCAVVVTDAPAEVAGINSRAELAAAEAQWQALRREEAMAEGVTLIAPQAVWFAWDTALGRDVTIEPNVVIEPAVSIGGGSRIEANLIVPSGSTIPPGTLVTRENMFAFIGSVRSSGWTGQYSLSGRAEEVVAVGPIIIAGLSATVRQMEWRTHNQPPDGLDADAFDDILPDLKVLRQRINELISAIEREGEAEALLEDLGEFYRTRVAPWFKARLVETGDLANGLVAASPILLGTYIGLSKLFDQSEFVSFVGAAIAGLAGRSRKPWQEEMPL